MLVYCTLFVRDSVLCNLPDTLNSNNFPPGFCNKKYYAQSVRNNTTARLRQQLESFSIQRGMPLHQRLNFP